MSKVYKKIYKKRNILKTVGLTLSTLVAVSTLASCRASGNVYSDIDSDGIYSKIGNHNVTNKELFNELSWSGADDLDKYVAKSIVNKYYKQVVSALEDPNSEEYSKYHAEYVEDLREYFVTEAYAVDNFDAYFDINNPDIYREKRAKAIDTLYTNGISLSKTEFDALVEIESKDEKTLKELTWEKMSNGQKEALKQYYSSLAQKLFALNYLNDEIADYEKDNNDSKLAKTDANYVHYYNDSKLISYWKSNYYYKQTYANAIMIRFVSNEEVTRTLKTFGVKLYKSKFYFIKQEGVTSDTGTIKNLSDAEYSSWYDDFDFTSAVNSQGNFRVLSDEEVLQLYVEMYNYIYPYREALNSREDVKEVSDNNKTSARRDVTNVIINSSEDQISCEEFFETYIKTSAGYDEYVKHKGTDLEKVNASLRNMVYDDLDDYSYSTSGTSNSNYYYMAFKFNVDTTALDESEENLYFKADDNGDKTQKDSEGKEVKVDSTKVDRERSASIISKLEEGLKDDDLTDTYIENAIKDKKKDAKISIYNENLSIAYAVGYADYYSKTYGGAPENDVLAKVEYDGDTTYVSTKEFYKSLESTSGISTAIDLLTKKIVKTTEAYKKTGSHTDEYYTSLNNLLTSFSNNGLTSYGYDSSIGKYNFLMMYFHASDVETIINEVYRVNDASAGILNNYASDNELINLFVKYTKEAYENTFTITATNLLVYVDLDEDGEPDSTLGFVENPNGTVSGEGFDWNQEIEFEGNMVKYSDIAKQLINDIIKVVKNGSDAYNTAITNIVNEYNACTRFTNGYDKEEANGNFDPTEAETYWAKYRRVGLYLKTEELSGVTNGTVYSTVNSTLKEELQAIYNRADFLFDEDDKVAPKEYLDTLPYENGEGLLADKGYNLLVVTSATINASAKFESLDDLNGIYSNLYYWYNEELTYISNLYNDSNTLSFNQILAYILEYADHSTSNTIPSAVSDAISSFFSAVYTKYTSSATQREILIYWCLNETNATEFEFFNTLNSEDTKYYVFKDGSKVTYAQRFEEIRNINKRSADNYQSELKFDDTSIYNDFWGDLETYVSNKYKKN